LQHFIEECPGIIQGEVNTGVVEECLKGKVAISSERGFHDEFLIGAMLVNERSDPWRQSPCYQRADRVAAEMSIGLYNSMEGHI
jgi:hypothetical protein